jgi:hypothetical protein
LVALFLAAVPAQAGDTRPADLVLRNGVLFTASGARGTAIAVTNGVIVFVGDDAGVAAHIGPSTKLIDLAGAMAAPGFHDAHMHPMSGGLRFLRCDLRSAATSESVRQTVRDCRERREESWLVGYGLRFADLSESFLTRVELDALSPDRPAFLASEHGGTAWVNEAAISAAGLDPSATPSVVSGDAAARIRAAVPAPSERLYRRALSRSLKEAARFGITSIVDANVSPAMLDAYVAAAEAGELAMRLVAAQRFDCASGDGEIRAAAARARKIDHAYLRADSMKVFLDGEFEDRTAALKEGYADAPANRGALCASAERLGSAVRRMQREALQIHIHAMGDGAVAAALDALESAPVQGRAPLRHQIAHLGLVATEDAPRFSALGVGANLQPLLAPADPEEAARLEERLGRLRASRLYPFAALARAGADAAAGSDWPSPSMNPLVAIEAMFRRSDRFAEVGLARALRAYTIGGARSMRSERLTGSLEVGKAADIVVFDQNLFALAPEELSKARVVLTLVAGRATWCDPTIDCPE